MTRTQDGFEEEQQQQHEQLAQVEQPKDGGLSVDQELALAQVAALGSSDHARLADLLVDYPELKEQILAAAGANLGNSTVQRALGIYDARMKERERADVGFMDGMIARADEAAPAVQVAPVVPAPAQVEQLEAVEQMKGGDHEMLAVALNDAPEIRGEIITKATEELGTETVTAAIEVQAEEQHAAPEAVAVAAEPVATQTVAEVAEEPKLAAQEDAWIGKARDYNERHAKLVEEFLELAGTELRLPDGTVDPNVIVAWQQANGVAVDGRIGPGTVAAARAGATKASPAGLLIGQCTDEANVMDPSCQG